VNERIVDVVVVGGGIGGAAAALRAAQYHLETVWVTGDGQTAKASRAAYVANIDNMIGIHPGIMRKKVLGLLEAPGNASARALVEGAHVHVGTREIVENVLERLADEYPAVARAVPEAAVAARREDDVFEVETGGGARLRARALVLATGVMDVQPRIRATTPRGRVVDEIHWIYPWANHETVLYCVRCEGHLTRGTRSVVIGAGEEAGQIALMLVERYHTDVRLLTNGEAPGFAEDTRTLLDAYGVEIHQTRITGIRDGGEQPRGSSLDGFELEDGTVVEARFAFVSMGLYEVYNVLARQLGAELEDADAPEHLRHVLVEDRTSETSVRGLFAVGDMAKRRDGGPLMKQVYTAQEFAVRAVDTIDRRRRRARRARVLSKRG